MSNPRIPFRASTDAPALPLFEGKRILVHLVVNLEHWRFDHPMPRGISTPPQGQKSVPDVPNFAWAEYGLRVGMPRMFKAIESRGLTAGCSINADVVEVYESIATRVRDLGWEFIGHGMYQKAVQTEDDERAVIAAALDKLSKFSGEQVLGWLGPGLGESYDTPDYLSELGIRYILDWVLDDQPCWMDTRNGPMINMPYNLELNDSPLYVIANFATGEFAKRLKKTLECFDAEPETGPKVLSLGLHPHLMGVPHRFGEFCDMLDLLMSHDDVAFVQGRQLIDWFENAVPAPQGRTLASVK
ncbi:hypothetical protein ATO6_10225 [Oceanicola sp. 22II-s10i]|uniref:polysaccharide deacetylase family protein n=1 Tax=Oceanicola sp. 22II-s10i TaxID=1317116 RepID=UPI000B5231E4|nr:polysaccharide deacetylase family protein [Oceanicola sp. 22II-s10i]OWU84711.1 hypothetical protein ATO6_10225 [Oceanicola sp. 22II-s10i]